MRVILIAVFVGCATVLAEDFLTMTEFPTLANCENATSAVWTMTNDLVDETCSVFTTGSGGMFAIRRFRAVERKLFNEFTVTFCKGSEDCSANCNQIAMKCETQCQELNGQFYTMLCSPASALSSVLGLSLTLVFMLLF
eukprot:c53114_g1_i1.p1 GENE.c53114_g1_i1~~c53114_g1_i1.p1  ORF type:complete len:139 (+),score=24.92 c53114_g1_i1:35-451(+)